MKFEEVEAKVKSRNFERRFKDMFPSIGSMYGVFPACVDDIKVNIDSEDDVPVSHNDSFYHDMDSILKFMLDHLLLGRVGKYDMDYVLVFIDVISNWLNLKRSDDVKQDVIKSIRGHLSRVLILVNTRTTIDEAISVLRMLIARGRAIVDNEPYASKVSAMYSKRLTEYLDWNRKHPEAGSLDTNNKVYEKGVLKDEKG